MTPIGFEFWNYSSRSSGLAMGPGSRAQERARPGHESAQSTLMPATAAISVHLRISAAMKAANFSGVSIVGVAPSFFSAACSACVSRPSLMTPLSRATIGAAVHFRGRPGRRGRTAPRSPAPPVTPGLGFTFLTCLPINYAPNLPCGAA